jgi:hypothetical protein
MTHNRSGIAAGGIFYNCQPGELLPYETLERLKKRGYEPMLDYYPKVSPQLNEPLYLRTRMYSGVRGAPHRLPVRPSTRLAAWASLSAIMNVSFYSLIIL